jgi:thiosulfate reductase cytochrome b subunit
VRNYTVAEWIAAATHAGFTVQRVRRHRIRVDFATWIERMRTPETMVAAIHALQAAASDEVRAYFAIEPDGSFLLDVMMLEATA